MQRSSDLVHAIYNVRSDSASHNASVCRTKFRRERYIAKRDRLGGKPLYRSSAKPNLTGRQIARDSQRRAAVRRPDSFCTHIRAFIAASFHPIYIDLQQAGRSSALHWCNGL